MSQIATRQKGLIRRDQLIAMRVPRGTVDWWVSAGQLHPVYNGVYLVGHAIKAPGAAELAAVYACGPHAVLSHRTAGEWWKMIEPRPGFMIQVTCPGHRKPGPPDLFVHRTALLPPDEIEVVDGVPVTSAARTVFDLASQASRSEVDAAYERGLIEEWFDRDDMIKMAMRHKGRRGIKQIRRLIDRDAPPSMTVGEAHRRLLELIRSSSLPHPKTEVPIGRYRADILWPEAKLVVEMDSSKWHGSPGRLESDKRRDADLAALGYLTLRITWQALTRRPNEVLTNIAQAYAHRSPRLARSIST